MRVFKLFTLMGMFLSSSFAQNLFTLPYYVNPTYTANIEKTLKQTQNPRIQSVLKTIQNVGSAYWIDTKAKVTAPLPNTNTLEGILDDASKKNPVPLVVFITYDLPNRDCNAKASNGEICCGPKLPNGQCDYSRSGECSTGLNEYKKEYIDKIVAVIKKYNNRVPMASVIEPDSLPNLVTNIGNPACTNSVKSYKEGIKYVVEQYSLHAPKVQLYLDAGHGGWLGWENNAQGFQKIVQELNIISKIRGFATNVANYQPIGTPCPSIGFCLPSNPQNLNHPCCIDPCRFVSEWNPCPNEANYALKLVDMFPGKKVIIDTGRNGITNSRKVCGNWCNPRGMGLGQLPTANTGISYIDAFFWLKTPGESDGCTSVLPDGQRCIRFDSACESIDSIGSLTSEPRAPEAGHWFMHQILMLAENANLGTSTSGTTTTTTTTTTITTETSSSVENEDDDGYWKCECCK